MKIIFVGTKNFDFFSRSLLEQFEKIIITNKSYQLPHFIENSATVFRVDDVYDDNAKTYKLDVQQCINVLSLHINEFSESKVFCNQESNLEVAEKIRATFSIYDHMNACVDIYRDKLIMKKAILSSKLRAPRFTGLNKSVKAENYTDLKTLLGEKFIVKPLSSVGSRGVYKISSEHDFINFINETIDDACLYEAEEFIDGDLYEFDTALQHGELLYSNVSRYSCPMADLQDGTTLGSIMVERSAEIHRRIHLFGLECLRALGAQNGCFHMELFLSHADELVFLEVAARSPGLMTVPAYQRWEGVNMYDLELLIQCGMPASDIALPHSQHRSRPSFFVVYPKISGSINALNTPETEAEIDIDWQVTAGQEVSDTTTNIDYAARFFVTCNNVDEAKRTFEYLTREFKAVDYA